MPMQIGLTNSIVYLANDGTPRTATTDSRADVNNPLFVGAGPGGTDDAWWNVVNPDNSIANVEWVYFRATDNSSRRVRLGCRWTASLLHAGSAIRTQFVHQTAAEHDEQSEVAIWLLDETGRPYRLEVEDLRPPFKRPLTFHVTHLG